MSRRKSSPTPAPVFPALIVGEKPIPHMSRETVSTLIDRWMNDPSFRSALRSNPEQTLKRGGYQLDPDEWAALKAIDWSQSDEQLKARASKVC